MDGIRIAYTNGLPHNRRFVEPETLVYSDTRLALGAKQSPWCPFHVLQNGQQWLLVEGHLYADWRPALERLRDLGPTLDDEDMVASLRSCPVAHDGEAVLVLYDGARGRMVVGGDRLGRLPLYYHLGENQVLVSRSQRFIIDNLAHATVDQTALAQLLLFGFPLGERTLTASVSRLLPEEFLVVNPRGAVVHRPAGAVFRRNPALNPGSFRRAVDALRDEFVAACRARALPGYRHVLSLSGGIDSRTTGAGMRRAVDEFSAITFVAPGSLHADERDVAAPVAAALGAGWRAYELRYDALPNIRDIIDLKVGLNPVDVAFGIDLVNCVQRDFGERAAFWTGEGADKLLCEHRPVPSRPARDQLVKFIVEKNAVLPPAVVSRLSGVSGHDMWNAVCGVVESQHGIEPDDAYVHFLLAQRVVRWHVEGEDRHRVAVWPVSPFFGVSFFDLARSVPPAWKRGRRLYRALLTSLAPDLASIALSGGHAAPASRRFLFEYTVRELARGSRSVSRAYAAARRWRQRRGITSPWQEQLQALVAAGAIPPCIDSDYLASIVDGKLGPRTAAQILTVVLAVNSLSGDGA